jgi:hydrogenase nickel incorporation protein HypA/HybF
MHELSLMEEVRVIIEQHAREHGFARVQAVVLEIGQLSGVEAEAMRFCFESVMAGGLAEGARLEIMETPGRARCVCGWEGGMASRLEPCPSCDAFGLQILQGAEMRVKTLDVE